MVKPYSPSGLNAAVQLALSRREKEQSATADSEIERRLFERLLTAMKTAQIRTWEWRIEDASKDWPEAIGSSSEKEETPGVFLSRVHPEDRKMMQRAFTEALREGPGLKIHHRVLGANGNVCWVFTRGTVSKDASGVPIKMAGVSIDVTEEWELEDALRRSNEELQQFAYSAAHDLQEPLRTMRTYADLLVRRSQGRFDEGLQECVLAIQGGAGRMSALMKDLLTYALSGHPKDVPKNPVAAEDVLRDSVNNLSSALRESGAEVTWGALPHLSVSWAELGQLVQNLLSNAVKYRRAEWRGVHVCGLRQWHRHPAGIPRSYFWDFQAPAWARCGRHRRGTCHLQESGGILGRANLG